MEGGVGMIHDVKKFVAVVLMAVFLLTTAVAPALASSKEETGETYASFLGDFIILRPLGMLAQVAGLGLFIATFPVAAISGNTEKAVEKLIKEPAKFTWKRPLGQLP